MILCDLFCNFSKLKKLLTMCSTKLNLIHMSIHSKINFKKRTPTLTQIGVIRRVCLSFQFFFYIVNA